MSKVMVVEDDASLREIYGIRITAEGYDVVSAGDGEEALAMAVREKPDLILSDVMMPKISGFDMLDILRTTPETANIKVIMMTALSAEDQRQRGERLGADRYLVKSQVGIEDVVNAIHEVLGDRAAPAAPEPAAAPAPQVEQPQFEQPQFDQQLVEQDQFEQPMPQPEFQAPAPAETAEQSQPIPEPLAPDMVQSMPNAEPQPQAYYEPTPENPAQ